MESIEIVPLVGAGAIQLGMARAAVHAALGQPVSSFMKSSASRHPTDTWFGSGFQVFYTGSEPTVEYIELSAGCGLQAICLNQPIFSTYARTLVQRFTEHAALDSTDPELGNSYVFPALELALWRPIADEPEGAFFSTIGVGVHGYFTSAHVAEVAAKDSGAVVGGDRQIGDKNG